ncbi:MAG: M50 family metallopeptidase [Candidatus Coprovivens sp.]
MKNILNKIRIDYSTYILILIGLLAGYIKNIFIILVIVFVHEFGHVFFFYLYNIEIESIVIYPFGGISKVNKRIHERIYKDILISLGGILFQCFLFILFFLLYKYNFVVYSTYRLFNSYNARIIFFNLIPLIPLDGSKLLFSLCSKYLPFRLSYIVMITVSIISFILFISYNIFFKLNDIIIYFYLVVNLINCIKKFKYVKNKFYLERILYDNYYNGIISNSYDIRNMRIDKYYYYKDGNRYINEKDYLLKYR